MGRILLRLGITPLLALFVVWDSASGPVPTLRWTGLVAVSFVVAALLILSFWRAADDPPQGVVPKRIGRWAPIVWFASALLIASVMQTEWPFRLSFGAAQSQLQQMVALERAGKTVNLPRSLGAFQVTEISADFRGTLISLNGAGSGMGPFLFHPAPAYAQRERDNFVPDLENRALGDDWYLYSPAD